MIGVVVKVQCSEPFRKVRNYPANYEDLVKINLKESEE